MRAQPWVATALLVTITLSGFATSHSRREQLRRLESPQVDEANNKKTTPLERAYLDAYEMLTPDTQCGRFFGLISRRVLDEFVIKLRDRTLDEPEIAIRMSGTFTRYMNTNGTEYRLFQWAEINRDGAFYRSRTAFTRKVVPDVGSFHSNTREARVLILLHELAHLIKDGTGVWLIPDDGKDLKLSRSNNKTMESKCGKQIRTLK